MGRDLLLGAGAKGTCWHVSFSSVLPGRLGAGEEPSLLTSLKGTAAPERAGRLGHDTGPQSHDMGLQRYDMGSQSHDTGLQSRRGLVVRQAQPAHVPQKASQASRQQLFEEQSGQPE